MKTQRKKLKTWKVKFTIFSGLAILVISSWFLGRTAAAPCLSDSQVLSANTTKIIKPKAILTKHEVNAPDAKVVSNTNNVVLPPLHTGLSTSSEPQLRRLATYEQSAGGAVASGMMIFTELSSNNADAQSAAVDMAKCLSNFATYNIKPIIIMEPTLNGSAVSFSSYRNGAYDSVLDKYFSALKGAGVTDSEMGLWTYFPEANLPQWGPVDVADFAPNVIRTVNIQKKYFPTSKASIMLDAESYPSGSTDWGNGSYVNLSPFINGIPRGLIDSFGLQGFPWAPPANQGGDPSYDPSIYLASNLAIQTAQQMGLSSVWLNTGTFAAMYANDKSQTVNMSATQRQQLLNGVITQAENIKNSGLKVSINLFSEDKSKSDEATDWSYQTSDAQAVFKSFSQQLFLDNIELWLFDN